MVFVMGLMIHTLQAGTIKDTPLFIKVYQWEIVGKGMKAAGTTSSLEQAQQLIKMARQGTIIESSTITSFYVSLNELNNNNNRIYKYTWSVSGKGFRASGSTLTEKEARQLIKRISVTSIPTFKLIEKH